MNKVYITSYNLITSLGIGSEESIKILETGKGKKVLPEKNAIFNKPYFPVLFNLDITGDYTFSTKIALKLLELLESDWIKRSPIDIFLSTSTGGIKETEDAYMKYFNKGEKYNLASSHYYYDLFPAIKNKYKDKIKSFFTFSTACSSAGHSIMHAYNLIKQGTIDKALLITFDALSLTTLFGFDSLKLISENGNIPLSLERDGLSLGEGGAIMLLEKEPLTSPLAEIASAYSNSDGYHITAPHPEGKMQIECIKKSIDIAGIKSDDINYINAHGTGTPTNDEVEIKVIKSIFNHKPYVSSLKGFIGHTVGSSCLIELILSIEMLKRGKIYQISDMKTPIDQELVPKETILLKEKINYFLKNSFGFGGNNVSVIVKLLY